MIHQIVIENGQHTAIEKNYVVGKCKVKILGVYFLSSSFQVAGGNLLGDDLFILQSQTLFQNIPNNRLIVAMASQNDFRGLLETEAYINSNLDLTILDFDTKAAPDPASFDRVLLTVDIIPIA